MLRLESRVRAGLDNIDENGFRRRLKDLRKASDAWLMVDQRLATAVEWLRETVPEVSLLEDVLLNVDAQFETSYSNVSTLRADQDTGAAGNRYLTEIPLLLLAIRRIGLLVKQAAASCA